MIMLTNVQRIKQNRDGDSRVGLSFASSNRAGPGKLIVSKVSSTSIFAGSGLCAGQEVLKINGESTEGKTADVVAAMIESLEAPTRITILAGPSEKSAFLGCSYASTSTTTTTEKTPQQLKFNEKQRQEVPPFLESMGVTQRKWERIVESFTMELMPEIQQCLTMDDLFHAEMGKYTGKQMRKGYVGFGTESSHERKVFMMSHQTEVQNTNLTLVANNVLNKANVLLNRHGVMAELTFTVKPLPAFSNKHRTNNKFNIPTAIKFTPIDDEDDCGCYGTAYSC